MKAVSARTLISLKKILFATDFSSAAEAALPYALEITRRYGAKVYAVHVRGRSNEEDKTQVQQETDRLNEELRRVPHEVVIGEGDVRDTVLNLINEKEIDLVVAGTHGRTGLRKVLLGSVAEAIFREAPCPVLTVGPGVAAAPPWNLRMHEILFATDFTPESLVALPYAISLAQENQARLSILTVTPPPGVGDLVDPEQYVASTLRQLRDLIPPTEEIGCQPNFVAEQGDPSEKILDVANRYHADVIVLGVRHVQGSVGTHLGRRTAYKVVIEAAVPVLTVRG
jgi:nucleotide-binding universal stress UspA family protein